MVNISNLISTSHVTNGDTNEISYFLSTHSYQLTSSAVPEYFWPTVAEKIKNQVYDAGQYFQMCQVVEEDTKSGGDGIIWKVIVIHPDGLSASDPKNIFIVDHAWTYQAKEAKAALQECEGLLERMCNMMSVPYEDGKNETLINIILKEMWKYNAPYTLSFCDDATKNVPAETKLPVWYILDEFGSRIQHDGDPNFRIIPFYYLPHKCCYSLLFPIKDVEEGDEVTRNYVESPPVDDLTRDAQMLPWFPVDLSSLETEQEEPPFEFFTNGRLPENLPDFPISAVPLPTDRKVKVYSDYDYIRKYLTDKRFEITESQEEADIIWISTHFKDFRSLAETPHKRVNQFPYESVVTVKDLLAIICRRCHDIDDSRPGGTGQSSSSWVIPTFCLKRELSKFVAFFQKREKLGLDNTWIVKPWNLARGLDHTVTDNLNHILRLPATGPKIAQKYLHNPVLFYREDMNAKVKFDLRFIVLLLNVKPLQVAVYKNFWIRFANKSFSLEDFEDYDKHFTVNNYNDSFLLQMFCQDFVKKLEGQYPAYSWGDVRQRIYVMIKELFEKATQFEAPRGIPHNHQCKGSYGLDVMLDWITDDSGVKRMHPKLLEVNFNSDCERACQYYPDFFNDLFKVMFLEAKDCETVDFL